jgi:hypothetical protein
MADIPITDFGLFQIHRPMPKNEMVPTLSQWTRESLYLGGQRDEAGTSTSALYRCYSTPESSIVLHYRTIPRSSLRPAQLEAVQVSGYLLPSLLSFCKRKELISASFLKLSP